MRTGSELNYSLKLRLLGTLPSPFPNLKITPHHMSCKSRHPRGDTLFSIYLGYVGARPPTHQTLCSSWYKSSTITPSSFLSASFYHQSRINKESSRCSNLSSSLLSSLLPKPLSLSPVHAKKTPATSPTASQALRVSPSHPSGLGDALALHVFQRIVC
jgi:hypothetical protein